MVLKVYHFQKRTFLFMVHELTDVSIDTTVALAKQKQTRNVGQCPTWWPPCL